MTTTRTITRRHGRPLTIAAGAAAALLLWSIHGIWGDNDLVVRGAVIGPVAVATVAVLSGLAAWALLAVLERTRSRHPARVFRIIASIVLVLSLAGPLGSGTDLGTTLSLIGLHTTVGLALIIGLPGLRHCRQRRPSIIG